MATSRTFPPVILGSASPRRADLLTEAGIKFSVIPSGVEEVNDSNLSPPEICIGNALLKARDVASQNPDRIVIGADTLVFIDEEPLGKPRDMDEALSMVTRLSGRTHEVCTGVAILHENSQHEETFHTITKVTFKPLDESALKAYLTMIDPLDKAGSYAAQDHGELIIDHFDGSYSNVVGLPIEDLLPRLKALA